MQELINRVKSIRQIGMVHVFILLCTGTSLAQAECFDVFLYHPPPFFIRSELSSGLQYEFTNDDGSSCTITLYKSMVGKAGLLKNVKIQWKQLAGRWESLDKKPGRILTGDTLDGWKSALAVGSFVDREKKGVVLLYSFVRDRSTAFVVFAFTDKLFKGSVETFSHHLHLINNEKENQIRKVSLSNGTSGRKVNQANNNQINNHIHQLKINEYENPFFTATAFTSICLSPKLCLYPAHRFTGTPDKRRIRFEGLREMDRSHQL